MLAGGATLASALTRVRKTKGRATATVLALAGAGLVALGARQRGTDRGGDTVETGADARRDEDGDKRVSDEAYAEAEADLGAQRNADESASVYQSASVSETEPNPRGMSDRSDVDADEQGDEEGDLRFVEGEQADPHRETHLEDETAHDTRLHPESDDEPTEIDLSEAAMADEASEAAGPHPEQSYPAREGTDPEPTSAKAPERTGEGAVAPADSSDDEDDGDADAAGETEADDADEQATSDDRSEDGE
ncbi:hypothetical protein GCM10028856_19700 [Halopiger thermotolerans]